MLDVRVHLPGSCGDMSLPTCGQGYSAALYIFVCLRCRRQKNTAKIVVISTMPPRTAPTMAAVGFESPPDCEGFGHPASATPVVELARTDVEGIDTDVKADATVVEEVFEVGVGVKELVRLVVVGALEPDAKWDQMAELPFPILLTFARCFILIGWTAYSRIACFDQTAAHVALIAAVEDTTVRTASVALEDS